MSNLSGGSSSESTASGLRPKIKPEAGRARGTGLSSGVHRSTRARDGSPLDQLTANLLDWTIMDDVVDASVKSYESDRNWQLDGAVTVLPDVYRTYAEYAAAWEPIMIREIQDGIVSNFASTIESALTGTFHCTVATHRADDCPLQHLESTFSAGSFGTKSTNSDGERRYLYFTPGVMDLLLISLEPLDLYETASTADQRGRKISPDKVKAQKVALGLLVTHNSTNNNSGASRTSQVMVPVSAWQILKDNCQHISTNAVRVKGSQQMGKIKSYKLCYTVVENLRSSWREFQALQDLGLNIPLIVDILGAERTFSMAATPPHNAAGSVGTGGELDNPFYMSPRSGDESNSAGDGALVSFNSTQKSSGSDSEGTSMIDVGDVGQNESKSSDFGAYNRTETVEQLVASWKMKGCTDKFMKYLRLSYNPSQLHAIHTAVDQQGFTLVQGPPGTGKTSTILGILNAIHIREYNQYYKLALDAVLGPEGQKCREQLYEHPWLKLIARLTQLKPRILVVAPSNTAVDNIILRIMEKGFVDGNGGKYFPTILRVGVGSKNPKIKSVTLEDLVDKELGVSEQSTNRLDAIEQLNAQITSMIKDVAFLQSMLVNLRMAYAQCRLPQDFELRVDGKSGQPYWVDHRTKSTSTTPPEPTVVQARGVTKVYGTIESLPDYTVFSHRLTQLLGLLDNASAKRAKVHAISTSEATGNINVRDLAERSIIDGAHVLFTTLNSAGHPSMESTEFCVTVVDEAAQSVEPSVLIALRRGCHQCIMVGDQQQLPATVVSAYARAARYDRSLFQRLIETGHPYIMLDTQYRMCPAISTFPSRIFYKDQLKNGENVMKPSYLPPFLSASSRAPTPDGSSPYASANFRPFMFLDLQSSRETVGPTGSQSNLEEVRLCVALIMALVAAGEQANCASIGSIGVISFYSDQVELLRKHVHKQNFTRRSAGKSSTCVVDDLEVNTVDGFQGKENDIIIISAVRANDAGTIGFLSDPRRLNVGLTRARKGLFVIGHAVTLRNNGLWRKLIEHAEAEKVKVPVAHPNVDLPGILHFHQQPHFSAPRPIQQSGGKSDFSSILNNYPNHQGAHRGAAETSKPKPVTVHNEYVPSDGTHGSNLTVPIVSATEFAGQNVVVSDASVGWVNISTDSNDNIRRPLSSSGPRPPPPPPPLPVRRPTEFCCKDRDYSAVDSAGRDPSGYYGGGTGDTGGAASGASSTSSGGSGGWPAVPSRDRPPSNPASRSNSRPGSRFADAEYPGFIAPIKHEIISIDSESSEASHHHAAGQSSASAQNALTRKRKAAEVTVEELEEGEVIDLT